MFGRVTPQSIQRCYSSVRGHLMRSYGTARLVASHVDHSVSMLTRTYRALQPVLKDAAPDLERRVTERASALKSDYNQLRSRVQDVDDRVGHTVKELKKKVPELGL